MLLKGAVKLPFSFFLGRFPFDLKFQNFRNGVKWHGNSLGKVPENPEIVEFPKSEPFNRNIQKFQDENQMERKFSRNVFENLGIAQEVVFCFGLRLK